MAAESDHKKKKRTRVPTPNGFWPYLSSIHFPPHVPGVHIHPDPNPLKFKYFMSAAKRPKLAEPAFDPPMSEVRRFCGIALRPTFLLHFLANLVHFALLHLSSL
jgi:hypothetical protein